MSETLQEEKDVKGGVEFVSCGFDSLSQNEKDLLVPLPYRVGYWMSSVDSRGGDESERVELATLECLITGYAQDMCKSEFMQRLMEETVRNKRSWDSWKDDVSTVPEECGRARAILEGRLDAKDMESFGENLFEIALSVAGAFCEESSWTRNLPERIVEFLRRILGGRSALSVTGGLSVNVSSREKAALGDLKKVLSL